MAQQGTITFEGKSGQKYNFAIWPFNSNWSAVAAVYAVTHSKPSGSDGKTHDPIYIGETDNLAERLGSHHKADCFRKHNANQVCAHQESDGESREAIEADILANSGYNWVCND